MSQYFIDVINKYICHRTKSLAIFIDVLKAKFMYYLYIVNNETVIENQR